MLYIIMCESVDSTIFMDVSGCSKPQQNVW